MSFSPQPHEVVAAIFGAWLNAPGLHGCAFAAMAAKEERIDLAAFFDLQGVAESVGDHIVEARKREHFALAAFPTIDTQAGIVDLLNALLDDPRWRWREASVRGRFAADLRWCDADRTPCSAIGFAPFGSMPVTRRGPYVAIGVWPGGFDNPMRKRPDDFVGVGDMKHDLTPDQYSKTRGITTKRVTWVRDVLQESGVITGVTFSLEASLRNRVEVAPSM